MAITTRDKKRALLNAFGKKYGNRFTILENDGGYVLYDKEQDAKLTSQSYGKYIGKIYLASSGDYYVYREIHYHNVDDLLKAIEEYNATLPFDVEIYNPIFKPSYKIEAALSQYLRSLGFVSPTHYGEAYQLKDLYGRDICCILYEVEDDCSGKVTRFVNNSQWQECEFTDLDSAVAAVNSLVATYLACVQAQVMNVLNLLMSSRATEILDHTIANNGLSEYITDAKEKAIVYLEQELKRLKGE